RLGPQRPRAGQGSSSLVGDLHRLDSPVGMRSTFEQPIPLQEAEAARQCRLVDGESTLELLQVRLAQVRDGRENTELRHPETARPKACVIELPHCATDNSQRGADTGRQPSEVLPSWQPDAVSSHGRHPTQPPPYQASRSYVDTS